MSDLSQHLKDALADRYRIERTLGRGGMATVFLAEDLKHGRRVAIKVLDPEVAAAIGPQRFLREIETVARLTHPHILPLHDSGVAGDSLFYVMPYVEGESLRDRLSREKQLPLEDALRIAREVADALGYAHGRGVVHRDIKPENILLQSGHAVVTDFGIARAGDPAGGATLTGTGMALGTPAYMSPEQAAGSRVVDGRSDEYSLGCVLYEMLAGVPPFVAPTAENLVYQHLSVTPRSVTELRPTVPGSVAGALARALAKTPADRFATPGEFAAALTAGGARGEMPASVVVDTASIAVLPFLNMSGDPENEYFSDGLSEDLINVLTRVEGLKVAARTSAFAFRGANADIREIGRRLGVQTALVGSVRRAGTRLRVTAQLINLRDGFHLWSEQFDRELGDVFRIQDEITSAIAQKLRVEPLGAARRPSVTPTVDTEAYGLHLKGRHLLQRRTGEAMRQALEAFEKSAAADPGHAPAYAGMADAWNMLGSGDYGFVAAREAFPKAKAAARRALELDPLHAEAWNALGWANTVYEWDASEGERNFRRAIEISPGYAPAHHWLSTNLALQRLWTAALQQISVARELDPLSPIIHCDTAWILNRARRHEGALESCGTALELDPNFAVAHWNRGQALRGLRRGEEAVEAFSCAAGLDDQNPVFLAALGHAHAAAGHTTEARRFLGRLQDMAQTRYVPPHAWVILHIGLGEHDRALDWLEKALADRTDFMVEAPIDPILDPIRGTSRFEELVRQVGFAG